jgi:hypothetical protein
MSLVKIYGDFYSFLIMLLVFWAVKLLPLTTHNYQGIQGDPAM